MAEEKVLDMNGTAENAEETQGEKNLDIEGIEEDAAAAEKAAEEAKQKKKPGKYTHTFENPYRWKGRTFDSLTFDWTVLSGRDHLEIETEIRRKGRVLIAPAFTGDFLAGMAARACTERDEKGKRVIDMQAVVEMPMGDFQAITMEARDFLLSVG